VSLLAKSDHPELRLPHYQHETSDSYLPSQPARFNVGFPILCFEMPMPTLTLEYTPNLPQLNTSKALLSLNQALLISGQFAAEHDIQSKAIPVDVFQVGTVHASRGFVHLKLALFGGRSAEVKKELSTNLLAVLRDTCVWPADVEVFLSVEIVEQDRESYSKAVVKA